MQPKTDHARFQVKICGVTRARDAKMAWEAGADAIGLNFYAPSPRSVSPERAAEIVAGLSRLAEAKGKQPPLTVGVFVNESVESILLTVAKVGLTAIQLHGDEPSGVVAALKPWPVIRAFRMLPGSDETILQYVRDCQSQHPLAGVLIDAAVPGAYGGTGKKADWNEVSRLRKQLSELEDAPPSLILAGGLTATNVAEAIEVANPLAVDTASGVESAAGIKDTFATSAFVRASLSALSELLSG